MPATAVEATLPRLRREDICRIVLTGESGEDAIDTDALLALVEKYCWQGSIRDLTTLRRDLWARRGEDSPDRPFFERNGSAPVRLWRGRPAMSGAGGTVRHGGSGGEG